MFTIHSVFVLIWLSQLYIHSLFADQTTVDTDCGPVAGTFSESAYVFKGIPYAVPPLADKRWKPPIPLTKNTGTCWNGVFNATSFGNTCMQRNPYNDSQVIGSEDCLFLNVWTPTIDPSANLPVMVWIHGGSLQLANGNWPTYSPTTKLAADTNVVYVSMNYRLHAFGFMALDILSQNSPTNTSGNFGFMDQQLAMRWVQKNIRNFGGDPNLVTVFGQSSGGTSIMGLLASPLSRGLFHRAWLMSASPVFNKTLQKASEDNKIFLTNTGCSDIDCLHRISGEDVVKAIPWNVYPYWAMSDQMDLPTNGYFDGAICIVDGYVVPEPPFEMWKNRKGIDVPLMIGTTAQEVDYACSHLEMNTWTWSRYESMVKYYLNTFPGNISAQALELYPVGVIAPAYQYTTMTSDVRVTCPNNIMTDILANSFTSPVYRYVSSARPSHPVHIVNLPCEARYACHMWDSTAFFGSIDGYYKPEAADLEFQQIMQKEMINFAKNGKPLSSAWKKSPHGMAILSPKLTTVDSYHSDMCEFWNKYNFFSYAWIN